MIANLLLWTKAAPAVTQLKAAGLKSIVLLALSALTTTLSWICYYRAMKEGTVMFASLVDKGSILVTIALSILLLGEPFTGRLALGINPNHRRSPGSCGRVVELTLKINSLLRGKVSTHRCSADAIPVALATFE